MRKQSGFTLIELLIVLAILGILVGIVTMSVSNLQATALARGRAAEDTLGRTKVVAITPLPAESQSGQNILGRDERPLRANQAGQERNVPRQGG